MKAKRPARTAKRRPDEAADVNSFLRELKHALKPALEQVLVTIRGAAPGIAEDIKWNAPSFFVKKTGQFFATVNVHGRGKTAGSVLVVLHQGAKTTAAAKRGIAIRDPAKLLRWAAKDRALVMFSSLEDVVAKRAAFRDVMGEWIAAL